MNFNTENLDTIIKLEEKRKEAYRRSTVFENELEKHKEISSAVVNGELKQLKARKVTDEAELLATNSDDTRKRLEDTVSRIELFESSSPETIRELSAKCTQARSEASMIEQEIRDQKIQIAKDCHKALELSGLLESIASATYKNKLGGDISNDGVERFVKQVIFGKEHPVKALAPYWAALGNEIQQAVDARKEKIA